MKKDLGIIREVLSGFAKSLGDEAPETLQAKSYIGTCLADVKRWREAANRPRGTAKILREEPTKYELSCIIAEEHSGKLIRLVGVAKQGLEVAGRSRRRHESDART